MILDNVSKTLVNHVNFCQSDGLNYLMAILICLFLIITEVEHFFINLLALAISSSMHYFLWSFYVQDSLCILIVNSFFCWTGYENIVSQYIDFLSTLFAVSSVKKKF